MDFWSKKSLFAVMMKFAALFIPIILTYLPPPPQTLCQDLGLVWGAATSPRTPLPPTSPDTAPTFWTPTVSEERKWGNERGNEGSKRGNKGSKRGNKGSKRGNKGK